MLTLSTEKGVSIKTKSLQPLILKPCCSKKINLKILLTNFVTIILSLHQKILQRSLGKGGSAVKAVVPILIAPNEKYDSTYRT